jgi:hypothetical protein
MVFKKTTKKGRRKFRKVVDCQGMNREKAEVYLRMDSPEVVQNIVSFGNKATSLDVEMAFSHVKMNEEFQLHLSFIHGSTYYAHVMMPFGARHSLRVFTRPLGHAITYIRIHWQVRIVAYMSDFPLLHQEMDYLELAIL